jgi:D-alanyl-D-alanine carboxypeptidase (penicillin-binding protein 5/6)
MLAGAVLILFPLTPVAGAPPGQGLPAPPVGCQPGAPAAARELSLPADAPPPPTRLDARSWLVADLDSGDVLGACAAHAQGAPASVQKLLLAATMLPRLNPAAVVTVAPQDMDFEPGSSAVGLLVAGHYQVGTLWLGLLLNSGNDAANVLVRVGGGTVVAGLQAMNDEARRLGAYDTHAVTPSGLDGPGQLTSAYDLALIARACFNRTDFVRYVSTRSAQIPPQPPRDKKGFQIQNDNPFLTEYAGAVGAKSGFTDVARHTFVAVARRDGRRLVATVLGAETRATPTWRQAAALLDWGFTVPRESAVDRLVTPEEVTAASPAPPSAAVSPAGLPAGGAGAGPAAGAGRAGGMAPWVLAGALVLTGLATVALLAVVRPRRGSAS